MPRVKCPRCSRAETVLRSGFIRKKQRYLCKECNYNFTLHHENRKAKNKARHNYQTTILDIANAMGISATTVSRALHDHPDISKSTKEAIKALAVEMDYHPNLVARNFASSQTQTIGVIIPNLEATFFSSMLSGIQKVASASGYKVIICQSNENHQTEAENIQALIDSRVDGLLICHSIESESYDQIKLYMKRGIPIIHFYRVSMETNTPKVVARDTEGAAKITEHLIEQGCNKIAIIVGPRELLITQKRLAGYRKILKKYGQRYTEELVAYTDFRYASITAVIDRWLALPKRPDAIFCIADRCAIYTIRHLKRKKIAIPDEICVAGFGNDLMGELIDPGLTTYNVQTFKIGETAMQLFFDQLINSNKSSKKIKVVDGNIIIRESTVRKNGNLSSW